MGFGVSVGNSLVKECYAGFGVSAMLAMGSVSKAPWKIVLRGLGTEYLKQPCERVLRGLWTFGGEYLKQPCERVLRGLWCECLKQPCERVLCGLRGECYAGYGLSV